jgi:aspartate 1-decarboxylase
MRRRMMKSKVHRATVTDADLHYVGSITLDSRLMELADIRSHEQVQVLDIDNGARFETYAIPGGPGDVCLNGAAARLVQPGDKIIVLTYADYEEAELDGYEPLVVHVDTANRPVDAATAARLAESDRPGPVRYHEIEAEVDRQLATLDAELDGLH